MSLDEEIQSIFLATVDKFIDFEKEEKEEKVEILDFVNSPKRQDSLKKKEEERGSFFGLMLEGYLIFKF